MAHRKTPCKAYRDSSSTLRYPPMSNGSLIPVYIRGVKYAPYTLIMLFLYNTNHA